MMMPAASRLGIRYHSSVSPSTKVHQIFALQKCDQILQAPRPTIVTSANFSMLAFPVYKRPKVDQSRLLDEVRT
jgi:hypothetical protein